MKNNLIRITDGQNRTIDIFEMKDGTFQIIMFEASTDYQQNAWFDSFDEAKGFAERWVFEK